jgi:hypothetical protein
LWQGGSPTAGVTGEPERALGGLAAELKVLAATVRRRAEARGRRDPTGGDVALDDAEVHEGPKRLPEEVRRAAGEGRVPALL